MEREASRRENQQAKDVAVMSSQAETGVGMDFNPEGHIAHCRKAPMLARVPWLHQRQGLFGARTRPRESRAAQSNYALCAKRRQLCGAVG